MEDTRGRRIKQGAMIVGVVLLVVGGIAYSIFRNMTPVSTEDAVERFNELNDDVTSDSYEVEPQSRNKQRPDDNKKRARRQVAQQNGSQTVAGPGSEAADTVSERDRVIEPVSADSYDVVPAEGVYRYVGSGYESFNGIGRNFEEDTHRIVVHKDGNTWMEHHIFSEERESWTKHTTYPSKRVVHLQRNKIEIHPSPYKRDTTVPFFPPLTTALFPAEVGRTWSGEFEGRTVPDGEDYTGTYSNGLKDDDIWTVGGRRVRVLQYDLVIELEGELEAFVTVGYWYAPSLGITVREDYTMDATAGSLNYKARWNVRLLSLTPER